MDISLCDHAVAVNVALGTIAGRFKQVGGGYGHSCGLKVDGTVACWGWNRDGRSTPPPGTFRQISVGTHHACGVKTDGTVACWGLNDLGQAAPSPGLFVQVSAGFLHTCGIKDDGTGIAPEHLSKVFEPFFTTKGAGQGTGLGLWVSYGIIKSFRGDILVESAPGDGTSFSVLLPLNPKEYQNV